MSVLRSTGWSVRPSFSPHGPTSPVTLLFDGAGLTQLAGDPAVAWQTPWSEVTHLRLMRRRRGATLVAVIAGVAYQWRSAQALARPHYEELRSALAAHGGREVPRSRRNGAVAVAALVIIASFAGYFGGLFVRSDRSSTLTALTAVNLSARDVSGTWSVSSSASTSELGTIMPAPGQVITFGPSTTLPAQDTAFNLAANHFQRCLGVASVNDRIYGLAGHEPSLQVSSPVFSSSSFGGIQVESTAQYYDSLDNVARDVAEMSRPSFGRCFAESNADMMIGRSSSATPDLTNGVNYRARTFAKGWASGGAVSLTLPVIGVARANLVVIVEAAGHYEVTLAALVVNLKSARPTIDALANSVLARVTTNTTVSA